LYSRISDLKLKAYYIYCRFTGAFLSARSADQIVHVLRRKVPPTRRWRTEFGGRGRRRSVIETTTNYFRRNGSRNRKGEIALLPTVDAREQAAAAVGTVVESMTSIPLAIII